MRNGPFALLSLLVVIGALHRSPAPAQEGVARNNTEEIAITRFRAIERAVVEVVRRVRPTTVAIYALMEVEFEGRKRFAPVSGGSGVIIDKHGYIVTNDHVAGHCDALKVVLAGGRKVPATLVARDEKGDIALLKIEGKGFPAAPLGESRKVKVGQWVIAAGNPFSLGADGEPVVTIGVVSGKGRLLGGRWVYSDSIQIDAEINPGNSGGPLFNLKGELIGINGMITPRHGLRANTGAAYAIPVDVIKAFLPHLRKGKDIEHGYSGIQLDSRPIPRGVLVQSVDANSPAREERIEMGDIILSVNGKQVNSAREYINRVSKLTAGSILSLKIRRKGRARNIRLKLTVHPARKKAEEDRGKNTKKER